MLESIAHPIIVYIFPSSICASSFGKRELAQLNPFDLVVLLSLSNTVQNAMIGNDNSVTGGLIGAFSLLAFNYLVVRYLFQHRRVDQILEKTHRLCWWTKARYCARDWPRSCLVNPSLHAVCHRQGFGTIGEVDSCVLEPGGTFSVQGKKPSSEEAFRADVLQRLEALGKRLDQDRAV